MPKESTKSDSANKDTRKPRIVWRRSENLCKAKEELQNQNKVQNQQLKRLLAEKQQETKAILNAQSTNNELENNK